MSTTTKFLTPIVWSLMMTNEEVADIVEQEGLGYAIQFYLDSDKIEDANLRDKWEQAKELLDEIDEDLGVEH